MVQHKKHLVISFIACLLSYPVVHAQDVLDAQKNTSNFIKKIEEQGIGTPALSCWLSDVEIQALHSALDIKRGGGVSEKISGDRVEMKNNQHVISLEYYRKLKINAKKGFDKVAFGDHYDPDKEADLIKLVRSYPNKMANQKEILRKVLVKLSIVGEQRSWIEWFKKNTIVSIELFFDYLASLDDEQRKTVMREQLDIISRVKAMNLERMILLYTKTDLYSGIRSKKHFPKPIMAL